MATNSKSKKKAEAPLTESQKETFAEAEAASKTVKPATSKTKAPKEVRDLGNGMVMTKR